MFKLIISSCLVVVALAGILPEDGRIIGGEETVIEKFPYQISMMSYSVHVCGGSILNKRFVLTAAHCTDGKKAENLKVRIGSTSNDRGGTVIKVSKIIQHEKYSPINKNNDASILMLETPIEAYTDKIQPTKLSRSDDDPPAGSNTRVSGWGRTDPAVSGGPENLRFVDLKAIDRAECIKKYPNNPVTINMFCCTSDGKDSCQGDSGGPLVNENREQVGIVSWGIGCGDGRKPGVYASIAKLRDWILTNSS